MSSSGQAKSVVWSALSFSTSFGKSSGFGASRRYSVSLGLPANISGVIDGNMAMASAGMESYLNPAEATTSLRTRAGWRIASCSAVAPPML